MAGDRLNVTLGDGDTLNLSFFVAPQVSWTPS